MHVDRDSSVAGTTRVTRDLVPPHDRAGDMPGKALSGTSTDRAAPAAAMPRRLPLHQLVLALALALGILLSPPFAQTVRAETPGTLIVNMTSDDIWTAQMALGFANAIHNDGHDVVVYLNVRAVTFANRHVPQHRTAMDGKTPHELLEELIDAGVRVFVCPGCTRQAGLSLDDRLEGVLPGGEPYREIVMAPGTRIVSY